MLIFWEPISGSSSYTHLTLVPSELYNILFVAFHANPIGGHLNAYQTLHRLRLRYYWPGMYAYVKRMCLACLGCALSNSTRSKSSELVYNFPIEAPFLVMHFDAYAAGKLLISKDPTCTSSVAVECAALPAWNPLSIPLPKPSRRLS